MTFQFHTIALMKLNCNYLPYFPFSCCLLNFSPSLLLYILKMLKWSGELGMAHYLDNSALLQSYLQKICLRGLVFWFFSFSNRLSREQILANVFVHLVTCKGIGRGDARGTAIGSVWLLFWGIEQHPASCQAHLLMSLGCIFQCSCHPPSQPFAVTNCLINLSMSFVLVDLVGVIRLLEKSLCTFG